MPLLAAAFPPSLYDGINKDSSGLPVITNASQILTVVANVIRIAMAFAGALAVIFVIVGGIFFVISAGNPANIKRAREILTNALVGLVITGLAYSIVTFIAGGFSK
jgi:uncharacterized membrane protein